MLSICLLLAWAWAQPPSPPGEGSVQEGETPGVVQPPAPPTLEQIWAKQTADVVLAETVARRKIGDYAGARRRLDHLSGRGELAAEVLYHRGILAEVQEDYGIAEQWYQEVAEVHPTSSVAADAIFRRAYCLEELGLHRDALVLVKGLQRSGRWSESDALAMALERGIVELRAGKKRRGIRRILRALDRVGSSEEQSWIQAKARVALVRAQLKEAARLKLVGNKKAARRLKIRARLMASAEAQAKVAFVLGEPEYALEGLLLLGDGYMQLYQDMLDHPPPRSIPPEKHAHYRETVLKRAAVLKLKAHARYDEGVRVAARTKWQGSLTERLKARRAATAPQSD